MPHKCKTKSRKASRSVTTRHAAHRGATFVHPFRLLACVCAGEAYGLVFLFGSTVFRTTENQFTTLDVRRGDGDPDISAVEQIEIDKVLDPLPKRSEVIEALEGVPTGWACANGSRPDCRPAAC